MPRIARILAGAALVASGLGAAPAQAAPECTETNPCYECVMAPCYPEDFAPFVLDKVHEIVKDS